MNNVATYPEINYISLCSGIGGLDLAVSLAIPESRCVCYVEREAFTASILVARMEDESLDQAPIWSDLTTFETSPWRGAVDMVIAGFPCQPVSVAGRRKGEDDERWLFGDVLRLVCGVGARWIFLENVAGLLSMGLGRVLGELSESGYDAEWICIRASEAGATHSRDRWFCLAQSRTTPGRDLLGTERDRQLGIGNGRQTNLGDADSDNDERQHESREMDGSNGKENGRREGSLWYSAGSTGEAGTASGESEADRGTDQLAKERMVHANGRGRGAAKLWEEWYGVEPIHASLFPPPPRADEWRRVPDPLKPTFHGVANGVACRVDRLRSLGNGVVPIQAALALRQLMQRFVAREMKGIKNDKSEDQQSRTASS